MLEYRAIEIFTSEEARWHGKPLGDAIVQYIASLKIAARCIVTRGTEGCYENGDIATRKLEVLSYNMPVRIHIILPAGDYDAVAGVLEVMVTDGIVAAHPLEVISHKVKNRILPRQVRVRDVMTHEIKTFSPSSPLDEVTRLLLSSKFTGAPVVDRQGNPVGVITYTDLVYKAGLPMWLGIMPQCDPERKESILRSMARKKAEDIMSRPVVCIEEDRLIADAVELLLRKKLKRLPVVDSNRKLVGNISRVDIFFSIMREAPDWKAFISQNVDVQNIRFASDVMRQDSPSVLPDTPVEKVIQIIRTADIQRVAVVDGEGKFLGLVSDRDLLFGLLETDVGIWESLLSKVPFTEAARKHKELGNVVRGRTAFDIMSPDGPTILENATVDEAVELMVTNSIKRLPVVDSQGKFKGMISRDSLLRAAFKQP